MWSIAKPISKHYKWEWCTNHIIIIEIAGMVSQIRILLVLYFCFLSAWCSGQVSTAIEPKWWDDRQHAKTSCISSLQMPVTQLGYP